MSFFSKLFTGTAKMLMKKESTQAKSLYTINPDYGEPFQVYCNMNYGGAWAVIQRQKGSNRPNFDRNWNDYVNGFGNPNYDHWLGLEKIHRLTKANSMLRVDLVSYTKGHRYALYKVIQGRKFQLHTTHSATSRLQWKCRQLTPIKQWNEIHNKRSRQ